MNLTAGEWLVLGIGLGTLSAAVTALLWRVFGRGAPRAPREEHRPD